MAEGLSATEVAKEISEHQRHAQREATGRDRLVTIIEAALLALVALLAAWSGYASAKWSTESRLGLAEASTIRSEANRAADLDVATLDFDAATFNTWFTAYVAGNQTGMDVAMRRFRPEFKVAFDAWLAADPFTNAEAPPGPTYMPEYERPQEERATTLDAQADATSASGAEAAESADRYVRITVFLATVLFLVGISSHFKVRAARLGLVGVGVGVLVLCVGLLLTSPKPPL
jgi:hypothetical protein